MTFFKAFCDHMPKTRNTEQSPEKNYTKVHADFIQRSRSSVKINGDTIENYFKRTLFNKRNSSVEDILQICSTANVGVSSNNKENVMRILQGIDNDLLLDAQTALLLSDPDILRTSFWNGLLEPISSSKKKDALKDILNSELHTDSLLRFFLMAAGLSIAEKTNNALVIDNECASETISLYHKDDSIYYKEEVCITKIKQLPKNLGNGFLPVEKAKENSYLAKATVVFRIGCARDSNENIGIHLESFNIEHKSKITETIFSSSIFSSILLKILLLLKRLTNEISRSHEKKNNQLTIQRRNTI